MEESDTQHPLCLPLDGGLSSTQTRGVRDTVEGTENSTMFPQLEEVEQVMRTLPFVTELSFVSSVKYKGHGVRVSLTSYPCRDYDSCTKKQETLIHISRERPTLLACLQELVKRLQDRHGEYVEAVTKAKKNAADTPNVM
jgi:hypothetical protein